MNQNRKQCAPGSENISRKGGVAPLNSRNVKFMELFAIQTSIAAANDGREKGFHLPETIRQLRRKRLIVVIEPPITFLPGLRLLTPELFAKILTNQRMGIQLPRIMRIISGKESCPS